MIQLQKTLVLTKLHLEEKGVSNYFYSKTQMFHGSIDVPKTALIVLDSRGRLLWLQKDFQLRRHP